jgi:hypothetical protein
LKAEDIREMNLNLSIKQRELTALETNRKHQKEALRRREEDLRGMLKTLIMTNFVQLFYRKDELKFFVGLLPFFQANAGIIYALYPYQLFSCDYAFDSISLNQPINIQCLGQKKHIKILFCLFVSVLCVAQYIHYSCSDFKTPSHKC